MLFCLLRSSHHKSSLKEVAFENFAIFTGKHLLWSLFLINLHAWRPSTLIKIESNMVVPVDIVKNLRNPFWRKSVYGYFCFEFTDSLPLLFVFDNMLLVNISSGGKTVFLPIFFLISIYETEHHYVSWSLTYENQACIAQIVQKTAIIIWNIFNMVAKWWCSASVSLWWFFKILKNLLNFCWFSDSIFYYMILNQHEILHQGLQ